MLALLSALVLVLNACGGGVASPPLIPIDQPAESPSLSPDIQAVRLVVYQYWEAFNSYDADGVLSYLEDAYRKQKEEEIRGDIGRMRFFRVKLGVEEEMAPVIHSGGQAEIKIRLSTPVGTKHVTYYLTRETGQWKIYLAQEE